MDENEIRALLRDGEGQGVEFKTSTAETRKAIESLCAFRNASGGVVVFGVSNDGNPAGITVGANTLENLANNVERHTDPPLHSRIQVAEFGGQHLVLVFVESDLENGVTYAYNNALIRVGRTNQAMSSTEQRERHQRAGSVTRARPRFSVQLEGGSRDERKFSPEFSIRHVGGDFVANMKWRFRGPRFGGETREWRSTRGDSLDRTRITESFDLTAALVEDTRADNEELAIEIRFPWQGRWQHELHRFPVHRVVKSTKVLWDLDAPDAPPDDVGLDRLAASVMA